MSVDWTDEDSEAAFKRACLCIAIAKLEERIRFHITNEVWTEVDYARHIEDRALDLMDLGDSELAEYEEVLFADLITRGPAPTSGNPAFDFQFLKTQLGTVEGEPHFEILKHRERKEGDKEVTYDLRGLKAELEKVEMHIEEEPRPIPEETKKPYRVGFPLTNTGEIDWPAWPAVGIESDETPEIETVSETPSEFQSYPGKTLANYAKIDVMMTDAVYMLMAVLDKPKPESSEFGVVPSREASAPTAAPTPEVSSGITPPVPGLTPSKE